MSLFVKLMVGGWLTTFAMLGFYALNESGKLLKMRKRMAAWLETSAARVAMPEESLQPENEDGA